jgi:steroid delta-isomerase-like uncharacterized protein
MVNEETVRKAIDAWNSHDVEAILSVFAPSAVIHDPFYPEPIVGREAIRRDAESFLGAFPDVRFTPQRLLTEGDRAGFEYMMTATHKGPLATARGTVQPTNRRIELRGLIFWSYNARGLITEVRRYHDLAVVMAQLGLVPAGGRSGG